MSGDGDFYCSHRNVRPHDLLDIVRTIEGGRACRHIAVALLTAGDNNQVEITLQTVTWRIGPDERHLEQRRSGRHSYGFLLGLTGVQSCRFVETRHRFT